MEPFFVLSVLAVIVMGFVVVPVSAGAMNPGSASSLPELLQSYWDQWFNPPVFHSTIVGLGNDDHPQYALLVGRPGGQELKGGPAATDDLKLSSIGDVYIIPNTGKTGIGTADPVVTLEIVKDTDPANPSTLVSTFLVESGDPGTLAMAGFVGSDDTAGGPTFNGYKGRGASDSPTITSSGDLLFGVSGYGWDTTTTTGWKYGSSLGFRRDAGVGSTSRIPGKITFATALGGADDNIYNRMIIFSDGNITIGGSAATAQLDTTGTVRFRNFGAGTLMTDANGLVYTISDEKYKTVETPYTRGLSAIMSVQPITYKFNKESGLDAVNTYLGFSAQKLRTAIPEAVFEKLDTEWISVQKPKCNSTDMDCYEMREFPKLDRDGKQTTTLSISDRAIIATLVTAVQEQQKEIEDLQARCGK